MGSFFRQLQKFFVNLIIIILIIMLSIQYLIKNDEAYQKFKNIEFAFQNIINGKYIDNQSIKVDQKNNGILVIKALQEISLSEVYIKVNGQKVMSFKKGYVELNVSDGDVISIDCKKINAPLWFEISYVSPEIYNFEQGNQIRIYQADKKIGEIQIYQKL